MTTTNRGWGALSVLTILSMVTIACMEAPGTPVEITTQKSALWGGAPCIVGDESVYIGGRTIVEGSVHSNNTISVEAGSTNLPTTIKGDLMARGNIALSGGTLVTGDVQSTGAIILQEWYQVVGEMTAPFMELPNGTFQENGDTPNLKYWPIPEREVNSGSETIVYGTWVQQPPRCNRILAPDQAYGNVTVHENCPLVLVPGKYSFSQLVFNYGSTLEIRGDGVVQVDVSGPVVFSGNTDINGEYSPEDFQVYSNAWVRIDNDVDFSGTITSPSGPVTVGSGEGSFNGCIHAQEVHFNPDGDVVQMKPFEHRGNRAYLHGKELWTQYSIDSEDDAEENDRFGEVIVSGDFNGDSYEDMVVGLPHEDSPEGVIDAGAIQVIYGSPTGLVPSPDKETFIYQETLEIFGYAEPDDRFGGVLAVGNFDGDGYDDLAIGVPDEDFPDTIEDTGIVIIIYGSDDGLNPQDSEPFYQDMDGIFGYAEPFDRFGHTLAAADFNSDGADDLAIGSPYEDYPDELEDAGMVHILYGIKGEGLSDEDSLMVYQNSEFVQGDGAEFKDYFGFTLTAGDFDGDWYGDLAIGTPYENFPDGVDNSGAVHILYGSRDGFDGTRSQFITQNTPDIDDEAEAQDLFGYTLTTGNFNGDLMDDLVIGIPHEDNVDGEAPPNPTEDSGAVTVLYGSNDGLSGFGSSFFPPNLIPFENEGDSKDYFGRAIAAGDIDGDGLDDLAVGIPFYDGRDDDIIDSGAVTLFFGSTQGVSTTGGQFLFQSSYSIGGSNREDDRFGSSLSIGDYNGDTYGDLAVGIPYKDPKRDENSNPVTDAGGINILYGFGIETPPGWLRGNTHTHSNKSDGKSEPEEVFAHYKSMGYDFLVISDHISTEVPSWKSEPCHDLSDTDLLCIDGEEMTSTDNHTNGIGIDQNIPPGTIQENLSAAVDTDPSDGISTIAHLNHPRSHSGLTGEYLVDLKLDDFKFMEIYNAGTEAGNAGADEALWKKLLDLDKKIYGFASDDAHDLSEEAGRAWIMVKATERTKEAILGAIDQGHFYATTGVMLNHCDVRNGKLSVDSINGNQVTFLGLDAAGIIETNVDAGSAEYDLGTNVYYVRAVITNDHDETAWCQPAFVNDVPQP